MKIRHGSMMLALMALALSGCSTATTTNPPRSATEELLLSTAADRALASISFADFAGKKVFVDQTYFESYDPKYVVGSVRDAVSRAGGLLAPGPKDSDVVLEIRSGGLSIDASSSLVGIAQTGLPIPLAGTISIPELSVYRSDRQHAIAKLALLAYSPHSLEHVFSSGPMMGKSYNKYFKVLGIIQFTTTDIPEKKRRHY